MRVGWGLIETPADDVLDRLAKTAGADEAHAPAEADAPIEADGHGEALPRVRWRGLRRVGGWLRRALQFFTEQSSSSVTRRIVTLNVFGLLALSIGIIYLSQFRAGLIDARVQSLLVQSQIIAGAIAASATVETDSSITINPDTLLNLQPGQSYGPSEDALYGIDFPINPERVAPLLRRLISPTKTRARIYDRDGVLLVDSRNLFGRGDILRFDLPPPTAEKPGMFEAERLAILKVFLIATAVMVLLSILLAGTIAEPVRRLAEAAESVRRRIQSRVEIPDFTRRHDEIGHLSGAFRDMTNALYSRIEAIESFAADVSHELKNPLTSLRSAVETLPLAKTDESRARLLAIIQHDVSRLDRLISDISDASRLDAELQRHESTPVDFARLLSTLVAVANEVKRDDGVTVTLRFEGGGGRAFFVPGHDSRLGQIVDNLIENAR